MQPTPTPSSPPRGSSPASPTTAGGEVEYPEPPKNDGSAPFHVLAALFDRLQSERKPDKRRKLLASWFDHWRKEIGPDLFPVLRLILPQKDRERAVYGLKEKNLAKAYIKLIPLGRHDPDAVRLLNWKKPTERGKSSGDFPTVLYEVVNKRSSVVEGSLTIEDVNDYLDQISENMGKSDIQSKILQRIYNRSTPEDQRWIVRIILKDMIISVKENTVFGVFHPDAYDLFNTCSDLKKVAWELYDPHRRLKDEDKAVQLFRAFAPMLCKRPTKKIEDSVKEMQGRTFIIEEKLDGERIQLHKRGNEYFYCSRKGKDYTYLYGKHVGTGSLTPHIDQAFDERVDEIILDGEMLVWDPVSERNLPFGTLKTAALDRSKKEHNPRPCFKVFDLLYLNGMSLLHRSTKFRKRNLRSCLKEVPGRIEFITEYEGKTAKDIRHHMDDIMTNRGEGLVLKHPDAEYVLNGRNKDWIKVKPEYMDNMGETVDLIVVAGNYGTGRRSGGVSTLICAVRDDRHANEDFDEEQKYCSFVRIGSGLSYADYIWIRQKHWKPWGTDGPDWYQVSRKGHEDKGDVYLEPEDSFIIKIKAAEIVSSDLYSLGFTMRFPRALHIRDDLSVADCMTATAVLDSIRSEKKRKMEDDDEQVILSQCRAWTMLNFLYSSKPKKKTKKTAKKPMIMAEYRGANLKDIPVESSIFEGYKFMVSSDPKSRTGTADKISLMQLIHAHGGKCVQITRDDPNLLVVYGGQITPYDLKLIMKKNVCDIIRPQWVLDCIANEEVVPLTKKYFFHATTARMETDDYNAEDSEAEMDAPPPPSPGAGPSNVKAPEPTHEEQVASQVDPSMAGWFDVGAKAKGTQASDSGSETEYEPDEEDLADSENEDVKAEPDVGFDEGEDEDWEQVEKEDAAATQSQSQSQNQNVAGKGKEKEEEKDDDVRMGEADEAMHYDQELIFKHLCFYLDSPSNARELGLPVKAKNEADVDKRFKDMAKLINDNGGRVSGLDDPKLTHVVLDKRDISRRQELIKRTSKPKRRHLVIAEFIEVCIEEETLLDEDEFMP